MILIILLLLALPAYGQTNLVQVVGDIGTVQDGVDWFLDGLEWGSGIAAVVFGFITVRRALSMGDAWND